MRYYKISFLFFYVCYFFMIHSYAQETSTDSLAYYNRIIDDPRMSVELVSAHEFIRNLKEESLKKNDYQSTAYYYMRLAVIEMELGELYDSENSAIESLKLIDGMDVTKWSKNIRKSIYNHLGILSRYQLNFSKAIGYYKKAQVNSKTPFELAGVLSNIGNVYREEGNHELAVVEYKKALDIISNIKDEELEARLLGLLGLSQSKIGDEDGLHNMTKAFKIRKQLDYTKGIISSNLDLSEYYFDRNKKDSASFFLNKAVEIADVTDNTVQKREVLSEMINQGDYSRALEHKNLKDSLDLTKQMSRNRYSEAKYNYAKKEEELKKSKRLRIIYQLIGGLILISSIFIFYIYRQKYKRDKINDVLHAESRISKKVHDELANDISDALNFIENRTELSKDDKTTLLNNLEDIYLRTRDISTEIASIDIDDFPRSLKNLLIQHNREDTKVVTNNIENIQWQSIPDYKKMTIYRALQELMINMKKHSNAKLVSIVFKVNGKVNEIHYVDDGVGATIDELKLHGLKNVESRINAIGGTFNFETEKNKGFKANIVFAS